jgi:hypothetical protein
VWFDVVDGGWFGANDMETIHDLMVQLDGADAETVNRLAWEKGSLPVRLAMLGLASARKTTSPLWYGYPPGVFISYKRTGETTRKLVAALADHIRGLGYRAFLDVESLDDDADPYFKVPAFIASLQDCTFYVLLLTELTADLMTGRRGKTSWIHDESQHALRLTNAGRLVVVPVMLEPGGATDSFSTANSIDLTANDRDFWRLEGILTPGPLSLTREQQSALAAAMTEFDARFLGEDWTAARAVLAASSDLAGTFDHQFRRMLLAMYTADPNGLERALAALQPVYGEQLVHHFYAGYCSEHGIPNVAAVSG